MALNDLALSWKDHHGVLISVFEKLLEKKTLVDCTLAAEGKFLKAHKIVLSACSPYLEALLNQENDKHPIIFLRDVHFEDLKTLVEFVYSGEIRIPEDRLMEFLSVAEALQIKGLGGTDNEGFSKKLPASSETLSARQGENGSPVPRKRPRRHSNEEEVERLRERESSPDVSVIESSPPPSPPSPPSPPPPPPSPPPQLELPPKQVPQLSKEDQLPASKTESVPSSSLPSFPLPHIPSCSVTVTEVLPSDIRNVKKEVSDTSDISISGRSLPNQMPDDSSSEDTLGLKQEFEQVTVAEDYSDMLPEDNREGPIIDQSQPSSSHQFAGYTSEHVDVGGFTSGARFLAEQEEQSASEGPSLCIEGSAFSRKANPDFPGPSGSSENVQTDQVCAASASARARARQDDALPFKKFHCPFCPKSFKLGSGYRQHITKHTGERPFECSVCSATFPYASSLSRHKRSHTAQRYRCSLCHKTFLQWFCFKKHMQMHV